MGNRLSIDGGLILKPIGIDKLKTHPTDNKRTAYIGFIKKAAHKGSFPWSIYVSKVYLYLINPL